MRRDNPRYVMAVTVTRYTSAGRAVVCVGGCLAFSVAAIHRCKLLSSGRVTSYSKYVSK